MRSLQELVPNSNKVDKASMLDDIIDYVKFLQLQVKVGGRDRLHTSTVHTIDIYSITVHTIVERLELLYSALTACAVWQVLNLNRLTGPAADAVATLLADLDPTVSPPSSSLLDPTVSPPSLPPF